MGVVTLCACLPALWFHDAWFLKHDAFICIQNFGSTQSYQFSWVSTSECILLTGVSAGTSPLNKYLLCTIELDVQPLWTTQNVICPVLLVPSASRYLVGMLKRAEDLCSVDVVTKSVWYKNTQLCLSQHEHTEALRLWQSPDPDLCLLKLEWTS